MIRPFNQQDLADDWEEAYTAKVHKTKNRNFNAIFSDDEDEPPQKYLPKLTTGYIDPVLSTSTYHIHQADNALSTLKQVALEEEGWKKALKHKSGVMVHMKNGMHKGDKTPIFKGEAVIQGFSPQAIFYVIGMRKLWDDQYEDGNLIENLNDTTSLTYEVMKSTATSKSRELALVEKIECTQNGVIIFACTSVETPKIPRMSGRTRANIKLQGWILEPLHGGSQPATKVIFVVQESMKGWVPSFTKKSLARRPLVIAKIEEYLEKKAERMRSQTNQTPHTGLSRRPSVMNLYTKTTPPPPPPRHHSNKPPNTSISTLRPSPEPPQKHVLSSRPSTLPQQSNLLVQEYNFNRLKPPTLLSQNNISVKEEESGKPRPTKPASKSLYPLHRHPVQKVEGVQLLKKLTSSYDYWTLSKQVKDTKCYTFNTALEDEMKRKLSFIRLDGVIHGSWTPEQLCSVIHCIGSRKIWDGFFEEGKIVERFSQKDYLVHWRFAGGKTLADTDISAITTIEMDPATNTVYTAAVSVNDSRIPPDSTESRIRAHTDLYGWMFRPRLDKHGSILSIDTCFVCNMDFKYTVPKRVLEGWRETVMGVVDSLQSYLTRYGCPPYIRRVAGKVVAENFDADTSHYQLTYTAKHQPSNSYRSRKRQVWCTDIRFHQGIFPHGLNIQISPDDNIRTEVIMKQQTIRIFTTHESVEGQKVTLMLKPLQDSTFDDVTYKYNGVLHPTVKPTEKETSTVEQNEPKEAPAASDELINASESFLLTPDHQNNNIIYISDDLSFNGQQISVIFIVMVICYYMGKFTSCSHSC